MRVGLHRSAVMGDADRYCVSVSGRAEMPPPLLRSCVHRATRANQHRNKSEPAPCVCRPGLRLADTRGLRGVCGGEDSGQVSMIYRPPLERSGEHAPLCGVLTLSPLVRYMLRCTHYAPVYSLCSCECEYSPVSMRCSCGYVTSTRCKATAVCCCDYACRRTRPWYKPSHSGTRLITHA